MSNLEGKYSQTNDNSVALPNLGSVRYGYASGSEVAGDSLSDNNDFILSPLRIKFFFGEVFGLLFIALTTLYIFAMPAALTKSGQLKAQMNAAMKRIIDIVGASTGLFLTLPFWIILPLLIKLGSNGPVFYTQVRVGVNRRKSDRRFVKKVGVADQRDRERRREQHFGTLFNVIKFRTMIHDAEKASGPVWSSINDQRITKIGSFLRKFRIDEIPQFINILKGEMSLVGPRPERPCFVRDLSTKVDGYSHRLKVKPGLTGLAQVENGYDSSIASVTEKVRFDLQYIKGWSLLADVRILCRTVIVVVTGRGAC
ncbi:MAG: sugar transferase [candidate division Zixibacteria bacterium]|nr:sugar transferase [candidate division Zixibacteria bacterium]